MMAHDKIKLNYEQADHMAKTFKQGAQQLQQTMQEMNNIAQTLEEGALLGRGGSAFVEALRTKLCPSLKKLGDKYTELEGDVHAAIKLMQQADRESKQQFK
jgi:WXG100 family type VII secretion target